jgi:hypothetical protein
MRKLTETWQFKAGFTSAAAVVAGGLMSAYISILQDYNERKAQEAEEEKPKPELIIQVPAPASEPTPLTAPDTIMPIAKAVPKKKSPQAAQRKLVLTPEVHEALKNVSQQKGIPLAAMVALCDRESACKPKAENPNTKACGLYQFMPDERNQTLYEVLYKFGKKNGYQEEAKWVERYERNAEARKKDKTIPAVLGYRPVNEEAKQKITTLCKDPEFNAFMYADRTLPEVTSYEKWLNTGRKAVVGEIVQMNNLGLGGMKEWVTQVWADAAAKKKNPHHREMLSTEFFAKHKKLFKGDVGATNKSFVLSKDGKPLTVRQAYNDIVNEYGGWGAFEVASAEPQI